MFVIVDFSTSSGHRFMARSLLG